MNLGSCDGVGSAEGCTRASLEAVVLEVDSFLVAGGDFFQKRMKLVFFLTIGSEGTSDSDLYCSWRSDLERKIRPRRVNGGRC